MEELQCMPGLVEATEWKELNGFKLESVEERNLKEFLSSDAEITASHEPDPASA
jgi:hypothetical protein